MHVRLCLALVHDVHLVGPACGGHQLHSMLSREGIVHTASRKKLALTGKPESNGFAKFLPPRFAACFAPQWRTGPPRLWDHPRTQQLSIRTHRSSLRPKQDHTHPCSRNHQDKTVQVPGGVLDWGRKRSRQGLRHICPGCCISRSQQMRIWSASGRVSRKAEPHPAMRIMILTIR